MIKQRVKVRWVHLLLNIPIIGYFYGGMSKIPGIIVWIKFLFMPLIVISGLWLWKGQTILKYFERFKGGT